jgi:hypothetical protein
MSSLTKPEDFEGCVAMDVEVFVYSIEDINGSPVEVGLITDWSPLRDTIYVNNRPYDQKEYVFLNQGDL